MRESSHWAMPSSHKKVIIRKLDRDTMTGYVMPANFVSNGKLEVLNVTGNVVYLDLLDVKGVYFVRDFNGTEGLGRKTFTTRPRTEGLWVRLSFKDNDVLEGLLPNDLTQLDRDGFLITPPDTRGNTQRIYVPRSALQNLTVMSVIGGGAQGKKVRVAEEQEKLFTE